MAEKRNSACRGLPSENIPGNIPGQCWASGMESMQRRPISGRCRRRSNRLSARSKAKVAGRVGVADDSA